MDKLLNIIKYTNNLKLLYVEDNTNARLSTMMVFEEFFKNIVCAVDGLDALEKFDDSFDLIITDINMPKLNGLDMTKKIRETNLTIPILVLSAYSESGFFMDSIKLGVDGYLLKPIDMEQFLIALGKIIDKSKLAEESKKNINLFNQYQEITDKSSLVIKLDLEGNFTYVNQKFCELLEYTQDELHNKNYMILKHPNDSFQYYLKLWNEIKNNKGTWQGIIKNVSKSGKSYYLRLSIKAILDLNGNIIEYISISDDISDIMNQEKRLTDLLDSQKDSMVILMQIERFEDIKKYYGIEISKKIEIEFFNKINNFLPENFLYKKMFLLNNGLFAFFKENNLNEVCIMQLAKSIKKLQHNISESVLCINDLDYDISVLISFSYGQDAYENAKYGLSDLLYNKQDFIFANDLIKKEKELAQGNLKTLKMIKTAIDNSNIIIHFQGIVDNCTQEIEKYEVLVRLVNEYNEILTPYHFLEVSKRGKYYYKITEIVLNQAFAALKKTKKDLTINLSAIDIEKQAIQEKIFSLLDENKDSAKRIVFELLEDEEIKDFNLTKDFILKVKKYGVKIAIDDFGAGYSNFERLLDYKPDIIKIDASLIKNIHKDAYSFDVVETIVSFAKKQNIKIVGEFVENKEIYTILKKLGIDYSQGYYFCKPEALSEIL